MKKLSLVLILCLIFLSCEKKKITHSFCYWKTDWQMGVEDSTLQSKMNVTHHYVRFFDVDWNPYEKVARPVATIHTPNHIENTIDFTPSIFITNDVVLNANKNQLHVLASNIDKRIDMILESYSQAQRMDLARTISQKSSRSFEIDAIADSIKKSENGEDNIKIKEVLIDCDWTVKSKDNYFYLLEKIKQLNKYKVSATIRLWQYKYYEKAGIPPVDKGLLMCYNLSSPSDKKTENSIGTSRELEQYITHDNYDLPLDIALPIFSWSVVFRGNEFKGIISDENDNFRKDTVNFQKRSDNKYVFKTDLVFGETYFRYGDEIRIEQISDDEMQKMIKLIKKNITLKNDTKITFFSWDSKLINNYGTDKINSYYAQFER